MGQGGVKYYVQVTHSSGVTAQFTSRCHEADHFFFFYCSSGQQISSFSSNKGYVHFSPTVPGNDWKSCQILSLGCLSKGLQLLYWCFFSDLEKGTPLGKTQAPEGKAWQVTTAVSWVLCIGQSLLSHQFFLSMLLRVLIFFWFFIRHLI